MSNTTCSCPEHQWRFYKAGECTEYLACTPGLVDWWERCFDDIGLKIEQHAAEAGDFYCDRCGTLCTAKGTTEPQVPWARVVQAEKRMAAVQVERDQARRCAESLAHSLKWEVRGSMYSLIEDHLPEGASIWDFEETL